MYQKQLCKAGWTGFSHIIADVSTSIATPALQRAFQIAFDYGLSENYFLDVWRTKKSLKDFDRQLHEKIIQRGSVITGDILFDEILRSIKDKNNFSDDTVERMRKEFLEIKKEFSNLLNKYPNFNDFKLSTEWTHLVKSKKPLSHTNLKIALVWRAMEMFSGHKIRDVQILSVIQLYSLKLGSLAQIGTGEGKTIIIAMLAVLLCLDGHLVDIGEKAVN